MMLSRMVRFLFVLQVNGYAFKRIPSNACRGACVEWATNGNINDNKGIRFELVFNSSDKLPPLLYLPGFDGVSDYSKQGLQGIADKFTMWRMIVDVDDRSTFTVVASSIIKFLATINTPVVVIGESFGGLLATYIALRARANVSKLILINPATSFDLTSWPALGAILSSSGPAYSILGTAILAATIVEPYQIQFFGQPILDRIDSTEAALKEISEIMNYPNLVASAIPVATLRWRLSAWLQAGIVVMDGKYGELTVPTLVLVGNRDRLLPSANEGYRLQSRMPKAVVEVVEFPTHGHAMLDGSWDLTDILQKSKIFGSPPPQEPIVDYYPTPNDVAETNRLLAPIFRGASSVFLSRNAAGKLERGLRSVPTGVDGRPVLLVGNHQLFGADLPLLIREFLVEKKAFVRGLAHPMIFQDPPPPGTSWENNNMTIAAEFLSKWGAVELSATAMLELLRMNATVLLYPGGGREAFHYKGEDYKLFWPNKTDFVRLAALHQAIIVPFAAIGVAESFRIIIDGKEALDLPVVGERFRRMNSQMPNVRPGVKDNFTPPLAVPRLPARNYFLFQQPFDTATLNLYDKKAARKLYEDVRGSVEEGVDLLQSFRKNDPYSDFFRRTAYEVVTGVQAPTAPLNSLADS